MEITHILLGEAAQSRASLVLAASSLHSGGTTPPRKNADRMNTRSNSTPHVPVTAHTWGGGAQEGAHIQLNARWINNEQCNFPRTLPWSLPEESERGHQSHPPRGRPSATRKTEWSQTVQGVGIPLKPLVCAFCPQLKTPALHPYHRLWVYCILSFAKFFNRQSLLDPLSLLPGEARPGTIAYNIQFLVLRTDKHKLSGLKQYNFVSYNLDVRSPKMGLAGLKPRCQQGSALF